MYPSKILTAAGAAVLAATAVASLTAATTASATTAGAAAGAADARSQGSPVQVVRPGQVVDTGHGVDLRLTRTERCVGTPADWSCSSVVDGNQAPDSVSVRTQGDASGTLYSPLYIGSGKAARMTVTADGGTYDVQIVTLAGHPGYATGYAWGAPATDPGDVPQITVYGTAGQVLAQL